MKRTDAEKADWKATMSNLARQIRKMSPEQINALADRLGIITCEGRVLSPHNMMMLYMQAGAAGPMPTMVAGFRQWKKVNRSVSKGQHSIGYIWVPVHAKNDDGQPASDAAPDETRFVLVAMFDVSQTHDVSVEQAVPA